MARPRFLQLPRERQEEILDLAARQFADTGFQGTSYNQLLERLNLGKSSAYYYFEDKQDLFLTVVERCYARFFESVTQLERPQSARAFWTFVRTASVEGFEFMMKDSTAAKLMQCLQRERHLLGELSSAGTLSTMDDFYDRLIREGQRLGAVRTDIPHVLLRSLVRNLAVTFDQWFVAEHDEGGSRPTPEDAADALCDLVRRMVKP